MQNILVSHFIFSLCNEGFGANKPFEIWKNRFASNILKPAIIFHSVKFLNVPNYILMASVVVFSVALNFISLMERHHPKTDR